MIYVTRYRQVHEQQITFEEILMNFENKKLFTNPTPNTTNQTITRVYDESTAQTRSRMPVMPGTITVRLHAFNKRWEYLRSQDRQSLYHTFYIPKAKGGLRRIDEPNADLMTALRELKELLESCGLIHHTAAYAYVKSRCTQDALKMHQRNKSEWFLKTDLSNFFGSTTLEFVMNQFAHIYPMSDVVTPYGDVSVYRGDHYERYCGKEELAKALELGFLNGGLPQGTPLSPALTNWIFVPIDYTLMKEFAARKLVYTRYADDMLISAQEKFPKEITIEIINNTMKQFNAPYVLKQEKTRFGSNKGENWNLGLMLNGNNEITVGHKNKKFFKAMVNSFILDRINNHPWDKEDVQQLAGLYSYYQKIEKNYFDHVICTFNHKYGVNFNAMLRNALRQ